MIGHVRKPSPNDIRDPEWRPLQSGIQTKLEVERYLRERGRMIKTEHGRRVSKVLFDIDPMDLRQFDVPEDEYDAEGEMIVRRLAAGEKLSVDLVREIFERMFGKDLIDRHSPPQAFDDVVKLLSPLLSEILKKPSKPT